MAVTVSPKEGEVYENDHGHRLTVLEDVDVFEIPDARDKECYAVCVEFEDGGKGTEYLDKFGSTWTLVEQ